MNERSSKNPFLHGIPLSEKQKAEIARRRESNPEFDKEELFPLSEDTENDTQENTANTASATPITEQRGSSGIMLESEYHEMVRGSLLAKSMHTPEEKGPEEEGKKNNKKAIIIPGDAGSKSKERAALHEQKEDRDDEPSKEDTSAPQKAPTAITMPKPSLITKGIPIPDGPEAWIERPHHFVPSAPKKAAPNNWKKRIAKFVATVAGFLGLTHMINQEADKQDPQKEEMHERESEVSPHTLAPQETTAKEETLAPPEPLTITYTLKKGDSLWKIADELIETVGTEDVDGTLTLTLVKELREANNITGDAARSPKMRVGNTLDLGTAYALLTQSPEAQEQPQMHETVSQEKDESSLAQNTYEQEQDARNAPEKIQENSQNTLTHPYLQRGETIWSRTHDMLLTLGMKPNVAKRGVLGAIILKDSGMNETQAMRIKAEGSKNFDPEKHRLHFERAKQAAEDLRRGMSPAEVAKKYGVKDVYKKYSER